MPEAHLTSPLRLIGGGLERATFEISSTWVAAVAERDQGSGKIIKQAACQAYMLSPRPDPRDVHGIQIRLGSSPRMMEVELTILRAHYQLLNLLHDHSGNITIGEDGSVRCSCHEGVLMWIIRSMLPYYPELSEARDG